MDWKKAAENQNADPLVAGVVMLEITRVLWGKKDGSEFLTKNGDPAPKLVCRDTSGREGLLTMTLSEKAAWTMARLLARCGADLDKLTAAGITIHNFKDRAWAERALSGRKFLASIAMNPQGYPEITPVYEHEVAKADPVGPHEPIAEDQIPF